VTDAVAITIEPAGDVLAFDLWDGDALPAALAGVRALKVEPRRWWLFDAGQLPDLGGDGAAAPIGGGLMRATLAGPGWRALLTVAGWFDVENPAFGAGQVAATMIHHVPVWIAPLAEDKAEVYFPPSYTETLAALWTRAAEAPSVVT
jgi:sarcosine oxidase gamma subunit